MSFEPKFLCSWKLKLGWIAQAETKLSNVFRMRLPAAFAHLARHHQVEQICPRLRGKSLMRPVSIDTTGGRGFDSRRQKTFLIEGRDEENRFSR